MRVVCLVAGLQLLRLVSQANGAVEQPDRVKNPPLLSHPRLLLSQAGQVKRMRLRLYCFSNVVVGMLAERYLLSVDLSDRVDVKSCRVVDQNETGAVTGASRLSYLWFQTL